MTSMELHQQKHLVSMELPSLGRRCLGGLFGHVVK